MANWYGYFLTSTKRSYRSETENTMRHIASFTLLAALGAASLRGAIHPIRRKPQDLAADHPRQFLCHGGRPQRRVAASLLGRAPVARRRRAGGRGAPRAFLLRSAGHAEREEFPAWGGTRYYEPALKVTRADGDRDRGAALPLPPACAGTAWTSPQRHPRRHSGGAALPRLPGLRHSGTQRHHLNKTADR